MTLPSYMSSLGLPLIKEDPSIHTNIRTHVADSDASAAYPSATRALNVSRVTTLREIISIKGIAEPVFRTQNLNIVLGKTNAIEYCTTMFKLKTPMELLAEVM